MKITGIETHLVNIGHRNWPFVIVNTDEGIHGVGEAYSCGPDKATVEVVKDFEDWLIGRDPRDVESIWQQLTIGSRFPAGAIISAAISGIEHALWDIAGKAAGLPVYRLLGGKCRDRIRVYGWVRADEPERRAEDALRLIDRYKLTALKMNPLPRNFVDLAWPRVLREVEARVAAVREAVGDDVDIALDPHARIVEPVRALEFCRTVAPYRPLFVEEALRPEHISGFTKLSRMVDVPLAAGEALYTKHQFRQLLEAEAVDIVQPDMCLTGISETRKIAALAESHYVNVAPHNPCGPVANAVNVQVAATLQNFLILEYLPDDDPKRRSLVDQPVELVDGYLTLPDRPGLGIDLNRDVLADYPFRSWRRPQLIHGDGTYAWQ